MKAVAREENVAEAVTVKIRTSALETYGVCALKGEVL